MLGRLDLVEDVPKPATLVVGQALRDAIGGAVRDQHDEPPRQGHLLGETSPLCADGVLRDAAIGVHDAWHTEQRILTEYLNRLDYGNLTTGPAEAAAHYFGKPLGDLSAAEATLLAGLPQSPSRLNPRTHTPFGLGRLEVAWRHPVGENRRLYFNPVAVDGLVYVMGRGNAIVALEAMLRVPLEEPVPPA